MTCNSSTTIGTYKRKFQAGEPFDPPLVHLLITNKCNLRYRHCFAAASFNNVAELRDLTLDEYRRISATMGRIGMMMVCGGEPFLKDDMPDVVRLLVRDHQVQKVGLSTNGLSRRHVVDKLERLLGENDIRFSVVFSVDGTPEIHDFIRDPERKRCYAAMRRCWDAVKEVQSRHRNLSVELSSVVNRYNHEHLDELYDLDP